MENNQCDCYHTRMALEYVPVLGGYKAQETKVSECWGTKERDVCACGGDKSKCTFYENVRKGTGNSPRIFNVLVNSKIDYLVNDRVYDEGAIIKVNELDGFPNAYAHYYTKRVGDDRIGMLDWIPKYMVSILEN